MRLVHKYMIYVNLECSKDQIILTAQYQDALTALPHVFTKSNKQTKAWD